MSKKCNKCNTVQPLLNFYKKKNYIGKVIYFPECKQCIEQQFKPEMNWDNHGEMWEIDHIKPCSIFDLTDFKQQEICFHYSNTQPLFKTTAIAELFGYTNEIGNKNKGNIYLTNKISN